jgi:hypothetical protein
MKKLAYACALLLSLMGFRRALRPVGFSGDPRANDLIFRDVIEQLQLIIDTNPNDIALKNLRMQIERVAFSGVADSVDRRRIASQISAVLVPDSLEDGFSILPRNPASEKWAIPADIPLSNFTPIIQQLPLFPTTDVLKMDAAGIRDWNLSFWIAGAFLAYDAQTPAVDWAATRTRAEGLLTLLPPTIDNPDVSQMSRAMGLYLLCEVATLNRVLVFVRAELVRALALCAAGVPDGVVRDLAENRFPPGWRAPTNLWTMRRLATFASHIVERHGHLVRCLQESQPIVFDMRLLARPRLLLQAFLTDAAIELNVPYDSAHYEFTISDGLANIESRSIFLTRTSLFCGSIKDGRIRPKCEAKPPLKPIAAIAAHVITKLKGNPTKYYALPMFQMGIAGDVGAATTVDGADSSNFVWNVVLLADGTEVALDQSGAALFCQVSDHFL